MSVLDITGVASDNILNEIHPADAATKWADLSSDKAKIFFDLFSNIAFYLDKIPSFTFVGCAYERSRVWGDAEKRFGEVKSFLSFPNMIKESMALYERYQKGDMPFKKTFGDVSFIVSDAVDSIKSFNTFGIATVPKNLLDVLGRVKSLAGFIGLANLIETGFSDLDRFKKINVNQVDFSQVKDVNIAVEIKKKWVSAEIAAKQQDLVKNITGIAMCVLLMTTGTLPWTFALLSSVGLVGKTMNYFHKHDASFWQGKYAEIIR